MTTKKCAFCQTELGPQNKRGKEHVLRESMLKKIDALHTMGDAQQTNGQKELVGHRRHTLNQLLAGEVCQRCNNGWIDVVDRKVEDVIFLLATGERGLESLTPEETINLSWWALKTVCTHHLTDEPSRRHIPMQIYAAAMARKDFPPETLVIASTFSDLFGVGVASIAAWPIFPSSGNITVQPDEISFDPYGGSFKVAIQYRNFLILVAHLENEKYTMVPDSDIHQYLLMSTCSYPIVSELNFLEVPPFLGTLQVTAFCYPLALKPNL
ncbi:MAG: hypothetical protein EOP04_07240 [Proteobacteria bacterium]|nr:MAG: hypothetical protein EOP04_07240 [Pseudomonadota bacterium]